MQVPSAAQAASQESLLVFSGAYGSAWRDGKQLADVIEAAGAVTIGRIDLPMVGKNRMGHKPGRETREGTMRVQKRDAQWEMEIYRFLSPSIDERRRARDAGQPQMRPFSLIIEYDDPYALARERWQLDGVLVWSLPLGFSLADDAVEREYPITWEVETPLETFRREVGPGGISVPIWYGNGPTP